MAVDDLDFSQALARLGMQGLAAKCRSFHQIFIFLSLKEWESLGVPLDSYNPLCVRLFAK